MSSLGVKIKIDFGDVQKLKNALKDKIKIEVDHKDALNKIQDIESKLKSLSDKKIDLKINSSEVAKSIGQIESKISDITKQLDKGLDVKVNLDIDNFQKQLQSQLKNVDKIMNDTSKLVLGDTGLKNVNADKIVRSYKRTQDEYIANSPTGGKSYSGNSYGDVKETSNKVQALKQMASVMKDINSLQIKQLDFEKSSIEYDAIGKRLKSLNGLKDTLVRDYNSNYKGDYNNESVIKQVKSVNDYNLSLKQGAKLRAEQNAYDKETETRLKDVVGLINQQHSLMKKSETSGASTNIGKAYADQAQQIQKLIQEKTKLYDLEQRLSATQKASLKSLTSDNNADLDYIRKLQKAKESDSVSKANYNQLKSELKDIYNLEQKIGELRAKEQSGVLSGKEESRMKSLQSELNISKEIHAQNKKNLELSEAQTKSYQDYESKRKADLGKSNSIAKEKAELAKIDKAYDDIASSMKKVNSYYKQMESAGDNEAASLKQLIALEEQRQAEIRETNNLKQNGNKAREEELATQKRLNQEHAEQSEMLRQAAKQDRYNEAKANRTTWADLIDPRQVYQEGKQAVMYMYNSVKEVEDEIVNIAKVIEPSEIKGLKNFREEIYDTASSVGKSAADYAVSVERWASSGKTLEESMKLGKISTIGSFVGNVDEASMVDYMSVPLIAFKKHGLEATDIINSMNEVANNNAIEMNDLGEAYKRASGTAAQSGTTFAQLTGLITAAQETTRLGGERIGTSLKAFDVNLGKITARLTKQDQTKFDFFKDIGVQLVDSQGEMRSTYDVLSQLQKKWSSLNTEQKNAAGFYIAGKQHQNILASILSGWDSVEKATQEAQGQLRLGEMGSAYQEFGVQQESLAFKQAALTNAWAEFINVVSGGKDTFAKGMDVITSALQKATELAKNPAIRSAAKAIASLFGAVTASVVAQKGMGLLKSGLEATFAPLTTLVSGFGRLKTATDDAANLSKMGKIVSGFSKIGAAFNVATAAFTVADIGLRAFTGEGLVEKAAKGFEHLYNVMHPATTGVRKFLTAFEGAQQVMQKNNEIRAAVVEHKKVKTTYEKTMEEKRKVFVETGDLRDLQLMDDEFQNIKDSHNALVEQLGVGADLKITFNSHNHIMQQLEAVAKKYEEIQKKADTEDWQALKKAQKENNASEFNEKVTDKQKQIKKLTDILNNNSKEYVDEQYKNTNGGYYTIKGTDNIRGQIARLKKEISESLSSNLNDLLSDPIGMQDQISALKSINESEKKLIKGSINSDNSKNELKNTLQNEYSTISTYLNAIEEVAKYKKNIVSNEKGVNDFTKTAQEYINAVKNMSKEDASYTQAKQKYMGELDSFMNQSKDIFESSTVEKWAKDKGMDYFNLAKVMEDSKLLEDFFKNVLPQAVQESKKKTEELQDALSDMADKFGDDNAKELVDNYMNNRSEFIRKAFALDANEAKNYLNLSDLSFGIGVQIANDNGMEVGNVFGDIQASIEKLQGSSIAVKYSLTKEDGSVDFEKITQDIHDLQQVDPEILVKIGLIQDGELQIDEFYHQLDQLSQNKDFLIKAGIEVDSDGAIKMNQFIEKMKSGDITIKPRVDGVEGWEVIAKDAAGKEISVKTKADTSGIVKDLEQVQTQTGSKTLQVDVKVKPNMDTEYAQGWNVQEYWDNTFGNNSAIVEQGVDVKLLLNEDGSVNLEQIMTNIQAIIQNGTPEQQEIVQDIVAHAQLKEGESLTIDDVTKYFSDLYEGKGKEVEMTTLVNLLMQLKEINKEPLDAEVQESLDGSEAEEYELEPTANVNLKAGEINTTNLDNAINTSKENSEVEVVFNAIVEGAEDAFMFGEMIQETASLSDIEKRLNITTNDLETEESRIRNIIAAAEEAGGIEAAMSVLAEIFGQEKVDEIIAKVQSTSEVKGTPTVEAQTTGNEEVQTMADNITTIGSLEEVAQISVEAGNAVEKVETLKQSMLELDGVSATATIKANTTSFDGDITRSHSKLDVLNAKTSTPKIDANPSQFDSKVTAVNTKLDNLNNKTATPKINADKTGFDLATQAVDSKISVLNSTVARVSISANASAFYSVFNNVVNSSGSVTVAIRGKKASQAISGGNRLGRSLSASIGQGLQSGRRASGAIGKSRSTATSTPATVNEDVWRYWAKELFSGLPLENSLDNLANQIKRSENNETELIRLYGQQISLSKDQINYQKKLQSAQQSELSEIISKLSGYGFHAQGNQITNFEAAKSLSGDRASEADKLLSDYKKLYESINTIDKKISSLNQDIHEATVNSDKAFVERMLKRSDAILTSVKNNQDLQKTKSSMVGKSDYELSMAVNAEGIVSANRDIQTMIAEFNRLSTQYVQFGENADKVHGTLEDLRDSILSNADAMLDYKKEINDLQIQKLTKDYDKFSDVLDRNLGRMKDNLDAMKDGLLSGETLSSRVTTQMAQLDFSRQTAFDRQQQHRIKLEADLNTILDKYAQANVDRTANVASSVLRIEQYKYSQLLNLANGYQNGVLNSVSEMTGNTLISSMSSLEARQNDMLNQWQEQLLAFHRDYTQAYQGLANDYDRMTSGYANGVEKTKAANEFVLQQLKLQEEMYRKIIELNAKTIDQARDQLTNAELTTEQREELLDAIAKYEESSVDAEKKIRDTVESRYKFQFDLMDEQIEKTKRNSEYMDHLLDIAKFVKTETGNIQPLYDAMYGAKVSEFNKVKKSLSDLVKEQQAFTEGSLEWKLLEEQILDVKDSLNDLTLSALNANRDLMGNQMKKIKEQFAIDMFGSTLEDWKEFRENWVTGISKELALEEMRKRLLEVEDETLTRKLEVLDQQSKVSQKDLDYIDKQMKVLELRDKLSNIEGERKVQELVKDENGKWAFAYVADQTEYDKTKKELNDAEKDLDKYTNDQRVKYNEAIAGILDKAAKGEYQSAEQLATDINNVNSIYGMSVGDDLTGMPMTTDEIVAKYRNYLLNNGMIVGDSLSPAITTSPLVSSIGTQFETAFMNISTDLGRIIGQEIRNALMTPTDGSTLGSVYNIQSLEFPNVTDPTGFKEVLQGLATVAQQQVLKKG